MGGQRLGIIAGENVTSHADAPRFSNVFGCLRKETNVMLRLPVSFRVSALLCLTMFSTATVSADTSAELKILKGAVSRNVPIGTGSHAEAVADAMVVLCVTIPGAYNCNTVAATVSDSNGAFEFVIDRLVSAGQYAVRARGVGDVWSTHSLGLGSDVSQWLKFTQVTVGDSTSVRDDLDRDAEAMDREQARNAQQEAQIQGQIHSLQQEVVLQQQHAQAAQTAINRTAELPADAAIRVQELQQAQQQFEERQQELRQQQMILAEIQAEDRVLHQRRQDVAQKLQAVQAPSFGTKRVIFATDRSINTSGAKVQILNLHNATGDLTFGLCDVAVERQGSVSDNLIHLIVDRDADRFFSVQTVSLINKDTMWREVGSILSATSSHDALLFIHGYNVSFDDGCRRAAQIAYDIKFNGPVFLYSWPSHHSALAYGGDEEMAEWSGPHFTKFIKELLATHGIDHLHIIAHSMGNRILARALFMDKLSAAEQARLGQIVFAAPDVNRLIFDQQDVVADIKPTRVTLYASDHDQALALSKLFHGFSRLGDARPDIDLQSGMDSVDASAVDTSLLGHSYIGTSRSVLVDLAALISYNTEPDKRVGVLKAGKPSKQWWVLNP